MSKRREIYAINPSRKKKTKKRKVSKMAKKRRKTTKARRRSYKRNPSRKRRTSAAKSIARRGFMGLSFRKALGNIPANQIGMFAAKWACKRFGNAASETDPESWTWDSYIKGALGGVGAGILTNMIKPGTGQKVMEGALNLIIYKALQNELIAKSEWAAGQFGQDDYIPDEYLLTGADENWFLGPNGRAYPTDEMYRLPEASMGDALVRPGRLGEALVRPGRLGATEIDEYRRAYSHAG